MDDIQASINAVEMARRKISILPWFPGLSSRASPGKQKEKDTCNRRPSCSSTYSTSMSPTTCSTSRHTKKCALPARRSPSNAWEGAWKEFYHKPWSSKPRKTQPFSAFPLLVDRLREKLTSERLSKTASNGWPWNWKNRTRTVIFLIILDDVHSNGWIWLTVASLRCGKYRIFANPYKK